MDLSTYIMAKKYTDNHGGGGGGGYSAGTGIDITGSTISVDADSAPTKNSQKPVTSGGTKSAIDASQNTSLQMLSDTVGWTGKNLLNADVLFGSASYHSIGLSVFDQIISLNGTISGGSGYYFGDLNKKLMLSAGTYTFSIVGSGNFGTASEIRVRKSSDSSKIVGIYTNNITPVSFTLDTDTEVFVAIVNSDATVGSTVSATLKIQLEKGTTATSYEPYHESVEEEINQVYVDNGVLGAKNLLPMNLANIKKINTDGTWVGNAYTRAGVTYTINTDSDNNILGITVDTGGSPSSERGWLFLNKNINLGSGNIKFYDGMVVDGYLYTDGVNHTNADDKFVYYNQNHQLYILVDNGVTVSNVTFYPMKRLASDPDDTYVPYAKTNLELTNDSITVTDACTNLLSGSIVDTNIIKRCGNVVYLILRFTDATTTAGWNEVIATIPEYLRPKEDRVILTCLADNAPSGAVTYKSNGSIKISAGITNKTLYLTGTWVI